MGDGALEGGDMVVWVTRRATAVKTPLSGFQREGTGLESHLNDCFWSPLQCIY